MKNKACLSGQKNLRKVYQSLYNQLTDSYWKASAPEARDAIHNLALEIYDVLTELNREDIARRTKEYKRLCSKIKKTNKKLGEFERDMEKIIGSVKTAAKVVDALEKVIETAAKFLI